MRIGCRPLDAPAKERPGSVVKQNMLVVMNKLHGKKKIIKTVIVVRNWREFPGDKYDAMT